MYRDLGVATSGAQYAEAINAMHAWTRRMAVWWTDDGVDLLLTPTLAEPPPELGDLVVQSADDVFRAAARALPFAAYTAPFNVTGQPAMSVPLAWNAAGLPLGMMFAARFGDEATLFRLAAQLEQQRPWKDKKPPLCA
jgi:Asp-tRNA(Asn)/Glu-tRNA(Gln) amidotransferase A subunit family amidase